MTNPSALISFPVIFALLGTLLFLFHFSLTYLAILTFRTSQFFDAPRSFMRLAPWLGWPFLVGVVALMVFAAIAFFGAFYNTYGTRSAILASGIVLVGPVALTTYASRTVTERTKRPLPPEWRRAYGQGYQLRLARLHLYSAHAVVCEILLMAWVLLTAGVGMAFTIITFIGLALAADEFVPVGEQLKPLLGLGGGLMAALIGAITLRAGRILRPHYALASDIEQAIRSIKSVHEPPQFIGAFSPTEVRSSKQRRVLTLAASLDAYILRLEPMYDRCQYEEICKFGGCISGELRARAGRKCEDGDVTDLLRAALGVLVTPSIPDYVAHMGAAFDVPTHSAPQKRSRWISLLSAFSDITVQLQPIIKTVVWILTVALTVCALVFGWAGAAPDIIGRIRP